MVPPRSPLAIPDAKLIDTDQYYRLNLSCVKTNKCPTKVRINIDPKTRQRDALPGEYYLNSTLLQAAV